MYLIFLIIILLIFIILNYLLRNNKEYFDSDDNSICNFFGLKFNNSIYDDSSSSGDNSNVYPCGEDTCSCAKEDEKCLVDSEGNNTCCDDLECIRKKNNFQYKVCSNEKDACGYFRNDYLKYIFDDDLWEEIYDKVKSIFETEYTDYIVVEEEGSDNILSNKRKEILDFIKVRGLCGEKYTTQDIRKKLDEFFQKDIIFSSLIYGVQESAQQQDDSDDDRDCKYENPTVNNY